MGGSGTKSGLSPEAKRAIELYNKMEGGANMIKNAYVEHMLSYDDDGNKLVDRTDNMHSTVGIGDDPSKVFNMHVVHNHPEGGCFSDADVSTAQYLKEMWAVTKDRIQIFRWNSNIFSGNFDAGKVNAFVSKVKDMYNNHVFFNRGKEQWDKKYGVPVSEMVTWSQEKLNNYMAQRAKGIKEFAIQKSREFFKNNQKKYGYTFNVKSYKKSNLKGVSKETLELLGII